MIFIIKILYILHYYQIFYIIYKLYDVIYNLLFEILVSNTWYFFVHAFRIIIYIYIYIYLIIMYEITLGEFLSNIYNNGFVWNPHNSSKKHRTLINFLNYTCSDQCPQYVIFSDRHYMFIILYRYASQIGYKNFNKNTQTIYIFFLSCMC